MFHVQFSPRDVNDLLHFIQPRDVMLHTNCCLSTSKSKNEVLSNKMHIHRECYTPCVPLHVDQDAHTVLNIQYTENHFEILRFSSDLIEFIVKKVFLDHHLLYF